MTITAAADGSALGNPGPAGWAWYVNDDCWAAGGWKHATNNQGELKAVLELFRATAHMDDELHILCDSQYVINSVTKWMPGWKKKGWRKSDGKPVLNVELLKEIDAELAGRNYRFEWVRGHVGHILNEAADARARAVAEAYQRGSAIPSGPGFSSRAEERTPEESVISALSDLVDTTELALVTERAEAATAPSSTDPLDDGALFSLDEDEWHTVTISLTEAEHKRLTARARALGVTPDDLLRSLI